MLDFYRTLQPLLPQVTQPLLMLCSTEDHVADPGSHRKVLESVSSIDVTEKMLPNSYHVATLDNDAPTDLRGVRRASCTRSRTRSTRSDPSRRRPVSKPLPLPTYARAVSSRDEDEAWRQIVANYGDAPSVEDVPRDRARSRGRGPSRAPRSPGSRRRRPFPWEDEGRFVPPPPPPIPRPEPRRGRWPGPASSAPRWCCSSRWSSGSTCPAG